MPYTDSLKNELFRFMYSTWKPKDVWDIAEHPDKYVIAISDMITTQFHVLGYKTRDKRMGEIYFRKWDERDFVRSWLQHERHIHLQPRNRRTGSRIEENGICELTPHDSPEGICWNIINVWARDIY